MAVHQRLQQGPTPLPSPALAKQMTVVEQTAKAAHLEFIVTHTLTHTPPPCL